MFPRGSSRTPVEEGIKHIYVDGGKTIQGFLEGGLIQHIIVTRIRFS